MRNLLIVHFAGTARIVAVTLNVCLKKIYWILRLQADHSSSKSKTNKWRNVFKVNPLSANPSKWSNTPKQFVGCYRQIVWVFDHFVGLALKGLTYLLVFSIVDFEHVCLLGRHNDSNTLIQSEQAVCKRNKPTPKWNIFFLYSSSCPCCKGLA